MSGVDARSKTSKPSKRRARHGVVGPRFRCNLRSQPTFQFLSGSIKRAGGAGPKFEGDQSPRRAASRSQLNMKNLELFEFVNGQCTVSRQWPKEVAYPPPNVR